MLKKYILATASYVVLSFALAYPWHLVWFHDLYIEIGAVTRTEPIVPLGVLSMIVQGAVIAYFYPLWYRGGHPVWAGIRYSLTIGLLIYTVMGFATAAKFDINPIETFLVYHTGFQFLQFTITGAALGLIFGRTNEVSLLQAV
ncbi:MAG: hypothetical protein P8X96_24860 [Desulfobacteraceae bacterium]